MKPDVARAAVLDAAQALHRESLVVGTAGNVSARGDGPDAMHITPSGLPYDKLTLSDIVTVTFDGDPIAGERVPSFE